MRISDCWAFPIPGYPCPSLRSRSIRKGASTIESGQRSPRTFYRIILANTPTLDDFLSSAANGRAPRTHEPEVLRLWDGLSAYATAAQALRKARGAPYLGQYIAEIRIPDDAPARFEKTGGRGHYTLWADPAHALSWVVSIVSVGEGQSRMRA